MARYSPQRELIREILSSTTSHPTAAWVYDEARKRMPNISLGTVYRNLEQLSESGEIESFGYKEFARFDGNAEPHPHFCCTRCGAVTDLHCDIAEVNRLIEGLERCVLEGETLLFRGICRECIKK